MSLQNLSRIVNFALFAVIFFAISTLNKPVLAYKDGPTSKLHQTINAQLIYLCSDFPGFKVDTIKKFMGMAFPKINHPRVLNLQFDPIDREEKGINKVFLYVSTKNYSKNAQACFKNLPKSNDAPDSTIEDMRDNFEKEDHISQVFKMKPLYKKSDFPLLVQQIFLQNEYWLSMFHMTSSNLWFSCKEVLRKLFGLPEDYCENNPICDDLKACKLVRE